MFLRVARSHKIDFPYLWRILGRLKGFTLFLKLETPGPMGENLSAKLSASVFLAPKSLSLSAKVKQPMLQYVVFIPGFFCEQLVDFHFDCEGLLCTSLS